MEKKKLIGKNQEQRIKPQWPPSKPVYKQPLDEKYKPYEG